MKRNIAILGVALAMSVLAAEPPLVLITTTDTPPSSYRDEQTGEVLLRVLCEAQPTRHARTAAPTLEDYYLWVFGEESGKEDG